MNWLRPIIICIVGWYIILITSHYFNQRQMWNDEVCVFQSIEHYIPAQFFDRPLEADQAFPRLYLLGIKQFAQPFHYHLLALRFFPFVSMALGFLLWMHIAWKRWGAGIELINFSLCWVASIPLIYYAAELKQYSMDVLATAVLVWLMLDASSKKISPWVLVLFPLLGILSYPAVFLMILPVIVLIQNKYWQVLTAYGAVCGVVLGYLYYFDLRVSQTGLLETYWHDYFISFATPGEFFKTFGEGMNNLISRWFVEVPKYFRAMSRVFMGFGLGYLLAVSSRALAQKRLDLGNITHITFVILLELIILGALHKFPFTVPRMSLFFAPLLLFITAQGLKILRERLPVVYWPFQISFWVYLGIMSLGIAREIILHGDLGAQSIIWQF